MDIWELQKRCTEVLGERWVAHKMKTLSPKDPDIYVVARMEDLGEMNKQGEVDSIEVVYGYGDSFHEALNNAQTHLTHIANKERNTTNGKETLDD